MTHNVLSVPHSGSSVRTSGNALQSLGSRLLVSHGGGPWERVKGLARPADTPDGICYDPEHSAQEFAIRSGFMKNIQGGAGRTDRPAGARMPTSLPETPDLADGLRPGPVRDWFETTFPAGPTPAQRLAWPGIAGGENLLLVSPTGTGKTLAAFLAILARLHAEHESGTLRPGLRCVYVSPLRSLGYDIERNLAGPLDAVRMALGLDRAPVTVGVRTGDTSAHQRTKLRDAPPHLLITTPESLALMLSQTSWQGHWKRVEHLIIDEVHALVPTKRGADLAISLERLCARAERDPLPARALGDLPSGRARCPVPRRPDPRLPGHRGPPARRLSAPPARRGIAAPR